MPVETATYIDDFVAGNPLTTDEVAQGDDHLRLIKTVLKTTFPDAGKSFYLPKVVTKSANYTVLPADDGTLFLVDASSGNVNLQLSDLTQVPAGFRVGIKKLDSSANTVGFLPFESQTIEGGSSVNVHNQYDSRWIKSDGTNAWADGFIKYVINFSDLSNVPTTISGYGITDGEKLGQIRGVNTQTTNYSLVLTDQGKMIEYNSSSAGSITIPANATVAFPIGTYINFCQINTGQLSLVAAAGVTINFPSGVGLKARAQYSQISAYKAASDTWRIIGDLTS